MACTHYIFLISPYLTYYLVTD